MSEAKTQAQERNLYYEITAFVEGVDIAGICTNFPEGTHGFTVFEDLSDGRRLRIVVTLVEPD